MSDWDQMGLRFTFENLSFCAVGQNSPKRDGSMRRPWMFWISEAMLMLVGAAMAPGVC